MLGYKYKTVEMCANILM